MREQMNIWGWSGRAWRAVCTVLGLRRLLIFLLCVQSLPAQEISIRRADRAAKAAELAIAEGRYLAAIPEIDVVLSYFRGTTDPEIKFQAQVAIEKMEFYRGFCYAAGGEFLKGEEALTAFIRTYPQSRRQLQAFNLLSYCQYSMEEWARLEKTLKKALSFRTVPQAERMESSLLLAETYEKLENVQEAFRGYRAVFAGAGDPSLRMASIGKLLEMILKLDDMELLYRLLPVLQEAGSPARYSLLFNVKAIEAAEQLVAKGERAPALVLLKICQPMGEIQKGLQQVRKSLIWRKERLESISGVAQLHLQQILGVERRLQRTNAEIEAAAKTKGFDEGLRLRIAQLLFDMEFYHESYWSFRGFIDDFPDSKNMEHAMYALFVLSNEVDDRDRALEHGLDLISAFPKSEPAAEVALNMAYLHQEAGAYDRMHQHLSDAVARGNFAASEKDRDHAWYLLAYSALFQDQFDVALTYFDKISPSSSYQRDVQYWRSYMGMFTDNYPEAVKGFESFLKTYRRGPYVMDASFRLALARFGTGDMEETRSEIVAFLERYPESALRGEAYHVLGDVLGSLGLLDEAIETYELVGVFTDDPNQVHSAAFSAGRIMEADSRWQDMLTHFQRYLNRYGDKGRYTMAVYRLGEALVKLERPDEALERYWSTILRKGDDPQALGIDPMIRDYLSEFQRVKVAEIVEANASKQQLRFDRAVAAFEADETMTEDERVTKLRSLKERDEKEAAEVYREAVTSVREVLQKQLLAAQEEAQTASNSPTMRLRFAHALYQLDPRPSAAPGFSERDLAGGTPFTLAWMAGILRGRELDAMAEQAYARVISDFPETEVTAEAYMGLGGLARKRGANDEALQHFQTLLDFFPTSEKAGSAAMIIGDILFDQEKFAEAVERYESIVLVREWRGPLWPEALYKVGRSLLASGEVEKAFAYLQRVYVLYRGHPTWMAKAYLDSGRCLEILERKEEALATYRELLNEETLARTPEIEEAKERIAALNGSRSAVEVMP